jgi:hypothetical protein
MFPSKTAKACSRSRSHPRWRTIRSARSCAPSIRFYGEGEFIYLVGVAGTLVGSVVTFGGVSGSSAAGKPTYQTALAPSTANLGRPLAVAMSANVAGQYGWYQIAGTAAVAENATFAAAASAYLAGAGQLTTAQANGKQMVNAITVAADGTPAAGLGLIHINRPFAQGQVA